MSVVSPPLPIKCCSPNPKYLRMDLRGLPGRKEVKMGSLGWAIIQCDLCPCRGDQDADRYRQKPQ